MGVSPRRKGIQHARRILDLIPLHYPPLPPNQTKGITMQGATWT